MVFKDFSVEEIKIALYLISLGIFIPTNYDLLKLIECKQKVLTIILKCLVSFFLILLCSLFTYKLKEGYVPQYGILIFVLGLFVYFLILRKSFLLKLDKIKKIINLIYHKFTWIFKPLRIFFIITRPISFREVSKARQDILQSRWHRRLCPFCA